MRWFDDLWLKEGFANLMAMRAADALLPDIDARNALRALKVSAYRTDVTAGTTPIWQALPNLSAAKSAYGSIVYSKAPAVLHQVSHFVGRDAFIAGVRAFLGRHAFANATWEELVVELEQASGMDLGQWAQAWVHRAGLPRVDIDWQVDEHGRIAALSLRQRAVPERMHSEQVSWPQRVELLLVPMQGPGRTFDVTMNASVTPIEAAVGLPAPKMAFANAGDWGYGVFMLNEVSMNETVAHLGEIEDGLLRALLWDALWEAVRAQRLHPREWVELALRELPHERDEVTVAGLLGNLQTALRWYLDDEQRNVMQTRAETLLERGMFSAATAGLRIACFRSYVSLAASGPARGMLKALLEGSVSVEGLVLRSVDRFRIVRTLLALGDPQAETLLERQREQDGSDDGRRHAYATEAARADIPTKLRYFDAFLNDDDLPERWIEDALTGFNTVEQEDLTLPLLERALKALPRLKRERRIFFVNNWLAAFLGGQRSAHAVHIVERFLADDALDADLRRKVLEAEDALMRTAAIRAR
jgi:aminopeptidase N